jgi:PIN domain nuclease of toxin-antitoxin system
MSALLDTHTFLWWITDDPQLSARARAIIGDADEELFLSAASGWEIAIKARLGKLRLPGDQLGYLAEQLRLNAVDALPVRMIHAFHVANLPDHHRDPFDRMLVAQCQLERLPILTADPQIGKYDVEVIW